MADFTLPVDITSLVAIFGIIGIVTTIFFQLRKAKRERDKDREEQKSETEVQVKEQKEEAEKNLHVILDKLSDGINHKLEIITINSNQLKDQFEEFKNINRDDLLAIKEDFRDLESEIRKMEGRTEAQQQALENKLRDISTRIQDLETKFERLGFIEKNKR